MAKQQINFLCLTRWPKPAMLLRPGATPLLYKALSWPLPTMERNILYSSPDLQYPATTQSGEFLWRVDAPFVVQLDDGRTHYELLVPAGWETDYGSVPRVFWNIVPPLGAYSAAYVLHDLLYMTEAFARSLCDWILLLALESLGCSWIERNTIYGAVRACGGCVWAKHDRAKVAQARVLVETTQSMLATGNNAYDLLYNSYTKRYELRGQESREIGLLMRREVTNVQGA